MQNKKTESSSDMCQKSLPKAVTLSKKRLNFNIHNKAMCDGSPDDICSSYHDACGYSSDWCGYN